MMDWTNLELSHVLALAAALGFASGFRLYALLFVIGLAGFFDWLALPDSMKLLAHPVILTVTGTLTVVELLADKIPAIDSLWDSFHTFIRLPAGAALAAGLAGSFIGDNAIVTAALALIGGTFAATSHFAKTGVRATINTSPEPVSNWTASVGEDVTWLTLVWLIVQHPLIAGVLTLALAILCLWAIRKLWRGLRGLWRRFGGKIP
ncbi:MAG: DUF4126 domain-containing protein [Burkholderiales bacterium]|jgi:hypothetical protein|nr:DUF4126 domain-containing protein [Burkholderiales bacterium]